MQANSATVSSSRPITSANPTRRRDPRSARVKTEVPPFFVRWDDDGHEGLFFPGWTRPSSTFPTAVPRRPV